MDVYLADLMAHNVAIMDIAPSTFNDEAEGLRVVTTSDAFCAGCVAFLTVVSHLVHLLAIHNRSTAMVGTLLRQSTAAT